ncbi:hypothetical protein BJX61DRAFT_489499 [Aspergillus egyptiacus]|nr:hypothetical protein BJX61DRAFT_489499 [Aspergillus egyptiacus]
MGRYPFISLFKVVPSANCTSLYLRLETYPFVLHQRGLATSPPRGAGHQLITAIRTLHSTGFELYISLWSGSTSSWMWH